MKKRILGILLAAVMIVGLTGVLGFGAMAASNDPSIIVVSTTSTSPNTAAFGVLTAYKLYDVTWNGKAGDDAAYTYTIVSAFNDADFYSAAATALNASVSDEATLLAALRAPADDAHMLAFAAVVQDWATETDNHVTGITGTPDGSTYTLPTDDAGLGYYAVIGYETVTQHGDTDVGGTNANDQKPVYTAAIMVTNANESKAGDAVTACMKLDTPSIDKFVYDASSPTDAPANADAIDSKTTDVNIGDTVYFKLTSNVPADMRGYDAKHPYTFIMHDTLDAGLTLGDDGTKDNANFVVTIGGVTLPAAYYTINDNPGGGDTFTITFDLLGALAYKDASSNHPFNLGDPIVVTYSATLNKDAVVFAGDKTDTNANYVYLEYSNSPYDSTSTGKNHTPKHEVDVYTYTLPIYKYTAGTQGDIANSTPLAGANFVLYYEKTPATTGSFTYNPVTFAPTNATGSYTQVLFTGDTGAYTVSKTGNGTIISGDDGMINLSGLDAGTYYLIETKEPDGFNILGAAVKVVITAPVTNGDVQGLTGSVTYTMDGSNTSQINVFNMAGHRLPETGGIGTTIFTVVGACVMLGAVIFLVARRKMRREDAAE